MHPGECITPLTALPVIAIVLVVALISCFINSRCRDSVEYSPGYFTARNVNFIVLVEIIHGDYLAPWDFFLAFLASTSRRVVRKNDTIV